MVTAARVPTPKGILCPNCGGNVELRGFAHTRSAVCIQCCSIIDPSTPQLTILQQFDERMRVQPVLPLGARGRFQGFLFENIGFQVRTLYADGVAYSWHEYLLFNPFHGFRYLTLYNGHWNFVVTVHGLPTNTSLLSHRAVSYNGVTYKHFQHAEATTTFVMGEFPWAVRVGEVNVVDDYVAPPCSLSSEQTDDEINWSHATYIQPAEVYAAFNLKQAPPLQSGVYSNQPSPWPAKLRASWSTFKLLILAWAVLLAFFTFTTSTKEVFRQSFHYDQSNPGEHSFVTNAFDIPSRGNVEVEIRSNLENNWAHFSMALLREDGSKGYDFGRDVSYYKGRDSDGDWSEGGKNDDVTLPRVDAGRYYLRIEPEMDPEAARTSTQGLTVDYEVIVKSGARSLWLFWLALPFLVVPLIVNWFRSQAFESTRWSESDYAAASSGSDSSSGDDD